MSRNYTEAGGRGGSGTKGDPLARHGGAGWARKKVAELGAPLLSQQFGITCFPFSSLPAPFAPPPLVPQGWAS